MRGRGAWRSAPAQVTKLRAGSGGHGALSVLAEVKQCGSTLQWQALAQVTKYVLAKAHTAVTVLHPATSGSGQQMEKNLKHVSMQHK